MNRIYVAILCVLLCVFALPASAQETPTEVEATQSQEAVAVVVQGSASEETITTDAEQPEKIEETTNSGAESTVAGSEIESTPPAEQATESEPGTEQTQVHQPAAGFEPPNVLISEINWAGSALSSADEWIELYNASGASVDLSGWILTDSATSGDALMIADGTIINSGLTILISNYKFGDEKTTLAIEPDLVTSILSLPNTKLEIILAMADGTVVDEVNDAGTPDFGSSEPKASMVRNLSTLEWMTADSSLNLSNETQLGTPGSVNVVQNVEESGTTIEEITEETVDETADHADLELDFPDSVMDDIDKSEDQTEETSTPVQTSENIGDAESETNPQEGSEIISETEVELLEETSEALDFSDNNSYGESNAADPQTPTSYTLGALIITEFVSDPEDGTEWIEIYNPGSASIDLANWSLTDSTDKSSSFDQNEITAGAYLVLENPKGKLNNDGDEIRLYDPSGNLIDSVVYSGSLVPTKGESLMKDETGEWQSTNKITKGEKNSYVQTSSDSQSESIKPTESTNNSKNESTNVQTNKQTSQSNDSNVSNETQTYRVIAIADEVQETSKKKTSSSAAKKSASSSMQSLATITGTITATPGTFGSQVAYLDGAQLYFYYADWPELAIGDVVSVTGVESSNRGEYRLKISDQKNITVSNHIDPVPELVSVSAALASSTGRLISVIGSVVERNGQTLILEDETGKIEVVAHSNSDIVWSAIESSKVQITGVIRNMSNEMKLYPRSIDDVVEIQDFSSQDEEVWASAGATSRTGADPWVGLGLLGACLGALAYWFLRNRKLKKLQPTS